MMNRLKSLDPPHKGLRNGLSQLTLLAGKTDYANPDSVAKLQVLGKEVFHLLKDHTYTENKFILAPLEAKAKGSTSEYTDDHREIDELETELYNQLLAFNGHQSDDDGHQFYLDLCDFQSLYLMHIDGEDTELEPIMQEHFTDEELIGHQIEIMKEMSFETLLLWFKYIVPARRPAENAQVLSGFKASAPAEAYEQVMALIGTQVSSEELAEIKRLIS
jgi:hypothetical protein